MHRRDAIRQAVDHLLYLAQLEERCKNKRQFEFYKKLYDEIVDDSLEVERGFRDAGAYLGRVAENIKTKFAPKPISQIAFDDNVSARTEKKISPPKLPKNPDVSDLIKLLQEGIPKGLSANQIARGFTKETPNNDGKAQSLLRAARRHKDLWKPAS